MFQFKRPVLMSIFAGLSFALPATATLQENDPALVTLVEQGDLAPLAAQLQQGDDPNAPDRHGAAALHYAAKNGRKNMVHALLQAGADIEAADRYGWTPLMFAASEGHLDITRLLHEKGAKLNAADLQGITVLMWSAINDHGPVVAYLIQNGVDLNAVDDQNRSALDMVHFSDQTGVKAQLIAAGVTRKQTAQAMPATRQASLQTQESRRSWTYGPEKIDLPNEAAFQRINTIRKTREAGRETEAAAMLTALDGELAGGCAPCVLAAHQIYTRERNEVKAEETLRRFLTIAGTDRGRASALHNMAVMYHKLEPANAEDLGRVEQYYKLAISKPEAACAQAFTNLIKFYEQHQHYDLALPVIQLLLRHQPNHDKADVYRDKLIALTNRANQHYAGIGIAGLDGEKLDLSEHRGKVVVLDFWTTWCGPCKASLSSIRSMARRAKKQPLVVIGINGDQRKKAFADYVKKQAIDWPQYWDPATKQTRPIFGVKGYPTFVVLDHLGKPIFKTSGWGNQIERRLLGEVSSAVRKARKARKKAEKAQLTGNID